MNLFPRNKSFIYNFTSMNSNTVGDTPEDCTIILPPLPYYQECDYYEVECIGFYINYESLDISAIPFNGCNNLNFIAENFATERNCIDICENQFLVCGTHCDRNRSYSICYNNKCKVKNTKKPTTYSFRTDTGIVRDKPFCVYGDKEPKKIRFRLYDENLEPLKKEVVNYNGKTHWTVSFYFIPMYESNFNEHKYKFSLSCEGEDEESEDEESEDEESEDEESEEKCEDKREEMKKIFKRVVIETLAKHVNNTAGNFIVVKRSVNG